MISGYEKNVGFPKTRFESCRWVFEKRIKDDPEEWLLIRKFYQPWIQESILLSAIRVNFVTANGRENNPTEFDYDLKKRTMTQLDRKYRVRYLTKEQYDATQENMESRGT